MPEDDIERFITILDKHSAAVKETVVELKRNRARNQLRKRRRRNVLIMIALLLFGVCLYAGILAIALMLWAVNHGVPL